MKTVQWFKRLADVPGISYKGFQTVDRIRLPRHDLEPEVKESEFEGDLYRSLAWPTLEGHSTTSVSPAHQHALSSGEDATPREALWRLQEILELPGEASDYHFAIQNACEAIYKRRQEDLSLLEEVERLCRLDIELVESSPKTVGGYEQSAFFHVLIYGRLIALYEGEGYFREALEVAERGLKMGQEHLSPAADRLRLILQELGTEDAER